MSVSKEMIASMRDKFLAETQQSPTKYHPKDVERVKTNDWWFERFALANKSEDTALAALKKTMEWRKSYGVNDFSDESFPEEIYKIGCFGVYPNKDKEGRKVIWSQLGHYHKSDLSPMIRQYIVYLFEQADRDTSHQGWAIVSDSSGAGLSNVDMDFSNFTTEVLQNHYPRGPKYNAVVDLPWILNATMKLVLAFMNDEMKSTMKMMKKDELTQYFNKEDLPTHLKGSYDRPIFNVPLGAKPMEQMCNFGPDQLKKIRSAFKDQLKQ